MYCRTCGNKMNDNAELCVKCGVKRNVGTDFCQVCGSKTTAAMSTCPKCGARLMKALSTAQLKKKTVSKSKKAAGNICLVFGILLMIGMIINLGYMVFGHGGGSGSIACAVCGGALISIGRSLRSSK